MQPMNAQQMGGPQVMNMQPMNTPQRANGPQVMNMQPMNAQQMNAQRSNSPQVMNMQPMNGQQTGSGPKILQAQASEARQVEEDFEWPDPVKKEIEVKELTEGRTKMILTLLLADKSTKKVFVTDDFTCQDLLNMFASKLQLWQTEFF